MKVTHEKLLEYMLKTDFQPILVNFWCGNLGGGGPKAYILKSGGAVAPLAPMVPPPMRSEMDHKSVYIMMALIAEMDYLAFLKKEEKSSPSC